MRRIACYLVVLLAFGFGLGMLSAAEQAGKPQANCPVTNGPVNKKAFTDYKGMRVYFCCADCIGTFEKSPDTYVQKMKKDGVVFEKAPKTEKAASAGCKDSCGKCPNKDKCEGK